MEGIDWAFWMEGFDYVFEENPILDELVEWKDIFVHISIVSQ